MFMLNPNLFQSIHYFISSKTCRYSYIICVCRLYAISHCLCEFGLFLWPNLFHPCNNITSTRCHAMATFFPYITVKLNLKLNFIYFYYIIYEIK